LQIAYRQQVEPPDPLTVYRPPDPGIRIVPPVKANVTPCTTDLELLMNLEYRSATPADARDCIRLRGLTRENAIPEDWLASVGITTESWAKDIQDGASPGFVCVAEDEMAGYCFGSSKTGEVLVLAMHPNYENLRHRQRTAATRHRVPTRTRT
jgi:hypothetical protein